MAYKPQAHSFKVFKVIDELAYFDAFLSSISPFASVFLSYQ